MQQPQYDDPSWLNQVKDREGKPGNHGTADVSMHRYKHLRMKLNALQPRLHRGEKVFSKPGTLLLVPIESGGKINPEAPPKND